MALTAGQRFADFEILGEIGRGGMGAVYQARQVSLERIVALKILPPHLAREDLTSRFQTEAVAAANLNHPNIVQVFAAGEQEGIRYIAMEFVEGESIEDRIRRLGRLPLTEALDIAYHVACALDYAWQTATLIHRDVKPDNMFLSTAGVVKLGDFGLAKMLREESTSLTATGHTMGSPHFISPEQAHGQRDIDFRADIYSLGCALHYMATGRMVFEGPDFLSIALKHVNEQPQPLESLLVDCPVSFERLVARMLKKDRAQRSQNYGELIDEIVHARSDAALWEASDAHRRRQMAAKPRVSGVRRVAGLVILGMLLVAGGFVYARRVERLRTAQSNLITLVDASDRRDFIETMAKLSPEERVARVMEKLREVNPAFSGKVKKTFDEDVVVELSFSTIGVTNLWPLCALKHLRVLRCAGDSARQIAGNLTDLSPLAELKELEEVDCSWNGVRDLRPLRDLPVTVLRCGHTRVEDVKPLKELPLTGLDIAGTAVRDIAPLAGLPLEELRCNGTHVRDLSPLRDAPLKVLWCDMKTVPDALLKSWKHLETINDAPAIEIARRMKR